MVSSMADVPPIRIPVELDVQTPVPVDVHIHLHHHFEDALTVLTQHSTRAVRATLGGLMTAISIDVTNETATVTFDDDKGDPTAAPAGTVATFTSDNEAVATVAVNDPANPYVAQITPVGLGTCNIGVTLADASGNPLTEADGTPWAPVDSQPLEVDPGAAVGARLSIP